jgi:hypothetical protein
MQDDGFVDGTEAAPEFVNDALGQAYDWEAYLDSGDLEGDHSIDGDLTITGNLMVEGIVEVMLPWQGGAEKAATWDQSNGFYVSGTGTWMIPIPVREGSVIHAIDVYARRGAGSQIHSIVAVDLTGTFSEVSSQLSTVDAGTSDAKTSYTSTSFPGTDVITVGADEQHYFLFDAGGTDRLYGIVAHISQPS